VGADPVGADGRGTIELIVAAAGPGSSWVTTRRPGDRLSVIGPLGQPYRPPADGGAAILVGGGYGSAPFAWWAELLVRAGHEVYAAIGAGDSRRLVDVAALRARCTAVDVSTDDGSAGRRGRVTDRLGELLAGTGARDVYACGPMAMLRAVTDVAVRHHASAWCTVEESMACGVGVCMTCVMPVRGADGVTRMTRSCTDGPTFAGGAVRWDSVCAGPGGRGSAVPADCLGAPQPQGGH
jgi:dihydroorotate dehydrogenase electron transfer subunit